MNTFGTATVLTCRWWWSYSGDSHPRMRTQTAPLSYMVSMAWHTTCHLPAVGPYTTHLTDAPPLGMRKLAGYWAVTRDTRKLGDGIREREQDKRMRREMMKVEKEQEGHVREMSGENIGAGASKWIEGWKMGRWYLEKKQRRDEFKTAVLFSRGKQQNKSQCCHTLLFCVCVCTFVRLRVCMCGGW